MRDESSGILDARVWLKEADGHVLLGERFRRPDGHVILVWHVDPKTIHGVMWVEDIGNQEEASAS